MSFLISLSLNILWQIHDLTVNQLFMFNQSSDMPNQSILTVLKVSLCSHIRISWLSYASLLICLCLQSLSVILFRCSRWKRISDKIYIRIRIVTHILTIHRMTMTVMIIEIIEIIKILNLITIYTITINAMIVETVSTTVFVQIITFLVNFLVNFLVIKLHFLLWINLIKLFIKLLFLLVSSDRIKTLTYCSKILWLHHSSNLDMISPPCSQQTEMHIVDHWINIILVSQVTVNKTKKTDLVKTMKQTFSHS